MKIRPSAAVGVGAGTKLDGRGDCQPGKSLNLLGLRDWLLGPDSCASRRRNLTTLGLLEAGLSRDLFWYTFYT